MRTLIIATFFLSLTSAAALLEQRFAKEDAHDNLEVFSIVCIDNIGVYHEYYTAPERYDSIEEQHLCEKDYVIK